MAKKNYISFTKEEGRSTYEVKYEDRVLMGHLIPLDDGYLRFWTLQDKSMDLEPWMLRTIADKIEELNEPWDAMVQIAHKN